MGTEASAGKSVITLDAMRRELYSAVVCVALDALGYTRQSPRVEIKAMTGVRLLVGRCKTMLWADMAHVDPHPYELELIAVDGCGPPHDREPRLAWQRGRGILTLGGGGELVGVAGRDVVSPDVSLAVVPMRV